MCDEIKLIIKNKNNKNVKFDFNIYNEIPLLYGDGVRLKQLICSLINYSLIYNESSYVFLDISGLLRHESVVTPMAYMKVSMENVQNSHKKYIV